MKTNLRNLLIIGLTTSVTLTGCVDLDYNEATVTGEDWVYENPTDGVKRMVSDVYAQMFNEFDTNYGGAIKASATDEADFANSLSDIHKFYNGGWSPANPFPDTWQRSYRAIAEVHIYLEKIDKINLDDSKYSSNEYPAGTTIFLSVKTLPVLIWSPVSPILPSCGAHTGIPA